MNNLMLGFDCGDDSLSIRSFTVKERMSEPFEITVIARSPDDDLDLELFVGKMASFEIRGKNVRSWKGICGRMEQIEVEATGLSTYLIWIVPELWFTTQRTNNRIFQHKSIPDIVKAMLSEWQMDATWKIDAGKFPQHEYRVQYNESDHDFMNRLLEEAGIAFYFDEKAGLTFADEPQRNEARSRGPICFAPNANYKSDVDFIDSVRISSEVRPGKYSLRDHDFRRPPAYQLFGKTGPMEGVESRLEQYFYMPGSSWVVTDRAVETPHADDMSVSRADDKEAAARAQRHLESVRSGKRHVVYRTNVFDLAPGVVFALDGHPRKDLSSDKQLLAVETHLSGSVDGEWTVTGTAYFADTAYRPPMKTQRPRIAGVQSAVVVGAGGEEIHTDELGRVRVQFHWDREGKYSERSSCWIRVSQAWAGTGQGMIVLPRVGQEVLVDFFDGDPDRPVVSGRVFSTTARVPHNLPASKTRSAWRSESSPRNGGFNEIMMEDATGGEMLNIHAQKDMNKRVNNNASTSIGNSLSTFIGAAHDMAVGTSRTTSVGENDLKTVGQIYSVVMPPPPLAEGAKSVGAEAAAGAGAKPSPKAAPAPSPSATPTAPKFETYSPEYVGAGMPGVTPPPPKPTEQVWKFGKAVLTADGSTLTMEHDINLTSGGNITIKADGVVTIIGHVIHLNP